MEMVSTGKAILAVLSVGLLIFLSLSVSVDASLQDGLMLGNDEMSNVPQSVGSSAGSDYLWTFTTEDAGKATNPVEFFTGYMFGSDGTMYAQLNVGDSGASEGEALVAINPDGSLKWSSNVTCSGGQPPYALTISPDGTIYCIYLAPQVVNPYFGDGYVGSYTQTFTIRAIYPENGTLKWEFVPSWGLIYPDDKLVVNSLGQLLFTDVGTKKVVALNPNATVAWTASLPTFDIRIFTIGPDDRMHIFTQSQVLYVLNSDGTMAWNMTMDRKYADLNCNYIKIGADGNIIFCLSEVDNSTILKINPNGTIVWAYDLVGSELYGGPIICSDGSIIQCYSTYTFLVNRPGEYSWTGGTTSIICLTADGEVKWNKEHDISGMAINSDGIIYGMSSSHYYAFDSNGTTVWEQEALCSPSPVPSIDRYTDYTTGQVILGPNDRIYYCGGIVTNFGITGYIMVIEGTPQITSQGKTEWTTIPILVNVFLAILVALLFIVKRYMERDGGFE